MKINLNFRQENIKKYALGILIVFIGFMFFTASSTSKKPGIERPADYSVTPKQTQLENYYLNDSLGKPLADIENKNPELQEVGRTAYSTGFIDISYYDNRKLPLEFITNNRGEAVAILRSPVEGFEQHQESLKQHLQLGEPEGTVYSLIDSMAVIDVYPQDGIAIYYEKESDGVSYIITFRSMALREFKQMFAEKFRDTRNPKAY